jgi:hypothetical protein
VTTTGAVSFSATTGVGVGTPSAFRSVVVDQGLMAITGQAPAVIAATVE